MIFAIHQLIVTRQADAYRFACPVCAYLAYYNGSLEIINHGDTQARHAGSYYKPDLPDHIIRQLNELFP